MMPRAKKDTGKNFNPDAMYTTSGKCNKKDFINLLKADKPNIILNIIGLDCDVKVSEEYEDELEEITRIVNTMAKNIWIDRTYVSFDGNRFKDSFIKEDGWYKMVKILIKDMFLKSTKKSREEAMCSLLTLATYYLYGVIEKYGYDTNEIEITFKGDVKFETAYFLDERTSWKC